MGYFNNNMERRVLKILWTPEQAFSPAPVDHQVPIRPLPLEFVAISRGCGHHRLSPCLAVGSALLGFQGGRPGTINVLVVPSFPTPCLPKPRTQPGAASPCRA